MKIISNKKWKKINETYVDLQLENKDLKEDNEAYKKQVKTIVEINKDLSNEIAIKSEELIDAKKTITKLKTLCTKNKIDYKEVLKCKNKK